MHRAARIARGLSFVALVLVALLELGGCVATFAPPVQSTHYGAPGRLRPDEMEIRGAFGAHVNGTAALGIDLADSLKLELAGDARMDEQSWAMGSAGLRYTLGGKPASTWWALDFELGAGVGVGGLRDPEHGGRGNEGWEDRLAVGAYTGLGFGFHPLDALAFFVRGRVQGVVAECVPATLWWSALAGVEVTIFLVSLYAAGGVAGYLNELDEQGGPIGEVGASIHF